MKIEAICEYKETDGIKQPEYLVRMSHKEVMALGGRTFITGEHLTVSHEIEHLRTVQASIGWLADRMDEVINKPS